MDYPRSAPSYFTSMFEISGFSESLIRCCVRIPLRAFPPSHLAATEDESAVSEDLPRSRVGFHGSLVRPSASGRVARFCPSPLARGVGHLAPTLVGPVADDVGLIRRCQRSTCVAAALPAPMRGKKTNYTSALRVLTKSLIFSPSSRTDSPLLKCR